MKAKKFESLHSKPRYGLFIKKPELNESLKTTQGSGRIFYFKGTNGSGKSTIPLAYVLSDPDLREYRGSHSNRVLALECPNYRLAVVGNYSVNTNCGGADTIKTFDEMEHIIENLSSNLPLDYDIIFEGILPSTIYTTWVERLKSICERSSKTLSVVYLDIPVGVAIERVKGRSGNDFNADLVVEKHKRIMSHIARYPELYPDLKILTFKSSELTKEELVQQFQLVRK